MAVKFRRVENSEAPRELRERGEPKKSRPVLPKIILLIVIVVGVAAWFAYYQPPDITAPFILSVEPVELSAPVSGTLSWMIPRQKQTMEEGEELARITTVAQTSGSPGARYTDLKVRVAEARADLQAQKASKNVLKAEMAREKQQAMAAIERLRQQINQARSGLEETSGSRAYLADRTGSVQKLVNLGAATEQEAAALRRQLESARIAHESARARLDSLERQLVAAREDLQQLELRDQAALAAADERIEGARRSLEELTQAANAEEEALEKGGRRIVLRAPITGRVFERFVSRGSTVRSGQDLVTLYDPGTIYARAYVPVRYSKGLKKGAGAKLEIEGRPRMAAGEVLRVHDRVVPLPRSLEERLERQEANVIEVDIALERPPAGKGFVPGEVGNAVIKK